MQIIVVRHGRTAFNAEGRYQGSLDTDLDETGRREAVTALGLPAYRADQVSRHWFARLETDPGVSGMVRGTLSMFSSLGRVCVAEGVESASQAEMLLSLVCRYAQG